MMPKLDEFFLKVILPEVLCDGNVDGLAATEEVLCYCHQGESGRMIACDSPSCEFSWFHFKCLNLPPNFDPGDTE